MWLYLGIILLLLFGVTLPLVLFFAPWTRPAWSAGQRNPRARAARPRAPAYAQRRDIAPLFVPEGPPLQGVWEPPPEEEIPSPAPVDPLEGATLQDLVLSKEILDRRRPGPHRLRR